MFWPTLNYVFRKDKLAEETERFYVIITLGLAGVLFLGGALHFLLFAQRITYVPLFDAAAGPAAAAPFAPAELARLLDREGVAYVVREGRVLVPRTAKEDCLLRFERETRAPETPGFAAAAGPARNDPHSVATTALVLTPIASH